MTTTHKREAVNVEDLDATLRARAAFRPSELAARWGCSPEHIYSLIRKGDLQAFRIGALYRIKTEEVARVEGCVSSSTGESGPSSGTTEPEPVAEVWVPPTVQRLNGGSRTLKSRRRATRSPMPLRST